MSFDDTLIDTAPMFLDTFGEPALYTPKNGAPREILVIVHRDPAQRYPDNPVQGVRLTIEAANDSETGIPTNEYNAGGDRVTLAYRQNGTPEEFQIVGEPVNQDAGMAEYLLR